MRHRLLGMRVYLCGAMDRVMDGGVTWRQEITPKLNKRGVIVFDPACKPMKGGKGDESDRDQRRGWVADKMWGLLGRFMKSVRGMDLRMVNITDFTIIRIDPDIHMCGSYEEMAIANHEKKPILVWTVGGKERTPWWVFGQIPHEHIFGSEEELLAYLDHVDKDKKVKRYKRWYFFDQKHLYSPEIIEQLQEL